MVLYLQRPYSEPFTGETYVKSCWFRLFVFLFVLKWYCLPSVVGLSYAHYFSKVFPETEGMCRADIWFNATSLRRWMFFYYSLSKNPLQYLNKDIQPILRGEIPPAAYSTKCGWTVWQEELDNIDTCEHSHKRVTMSLPEVDPTALPPPPPHTHTSRNLHSTSTFFLLTGSDLRPAVIKFVGQSSQDDAQIASVIISPDCILLNFLCHNIFHATIASWIILHNNLVSLH